MIRIRTMRFDERLAVDEHSTCQSMERLLNMETRNIGTCASRAAAARNPMATNGSAADELAALYRLVAHFRMTDMIDTHISARLPGVTPTFLINRYGVLFHEMRASDLVKIDHLGNVIDERAADRSRGVSRERRGLHDPLGDSHGARRPAFRDSHAHGRGNRSIGAGAWAAADHPARAQVLREARLSRLRGHRLESSRERERLVRDLGSHKAMILRNHGLLAAGATAAEAFHEIYFLERACQAQVQALAGGATLRIPPVEVCRLTASQFDRDESAEIMEMAWNAALRLIDDSASDYRS